MVHHKPPQATSSGHLPGGGHEGGELGYAGGYGGRPQRTGGAPQLDDRDGACHVRILGLGCLGVWVGVWVWGVWGLG